MTIKIWSTSWCSKSFLISIWLHRPPVCGDEIDFPQELKTVAHRRWSFNGHNDPHNDHDYLLRTSASCLVCTVFSTIRALLLLLLLLQYDSSAILILVLGTEIPFYLFHDKTIRHKRGPNRGEIDGDEYKPAFLGNHSNKRRASTAFFSFALQVESGCDVGRWKPHPQKALWEEKMGCWKKDPLRE